MDEKNEIVVIRMSGEAKLRAAVQIGSRMRSLGYKPHDYGALELGINLEPGWLQGLNARPTLAQLTVVARKLGLRVVIGDINLVPLPLQQDPTRKKAAAGIDNGLRRD